MKKVITILTLLFMAGLVQAEGLSIVIVQAELDDVIVGKKQLMFNGRSYKYQLDKENSLFSYTEGKKPAVNIRDLKVGEKYYFELISKEMDPKDSDFKLVRYVSIKSIEDEERIGKKDEK